MSLFAELATLTSPAYATPDFEGGSATGRVQVVVGGTPVSVLLAQLPAGAVPGLVGGTLRYRDNDTRAPAARLITAADYAPAEGLLRLTLDAPASAPDGDDVAVLWPGA